MKRIYQIVTILLIIVLLLAGGFIAWALSGPQAGSAAQAALISDSQVSVQEINGWTVFSPTDEEPDTGFILYPGGRVDPLAYAPAARAIAAAGYQVVIVPMPLNLAVLGAGRAEEVIQSMPQIETWAIGGHSLGGSMAANFAAANPQQVEGVILWASYPAAADDLSGQDISAVSIYGSEDGLATPEDIDNSRPLLPVDTKFVLIQGGNHAQFGDYGPQEGDNPALISAAAQQEQIVEATVTLLASISGGGR